MLLSVVGGGALLFYSSLGPSTAPEVTPLNAPKLKELPELMEQSYRDSMLWGSYRSGLYFGMKTRWGWVSCSSTAHCTYLGCTWCSAMVEPCYEYAIWHCCNTATCVVKCLSCSLTLPTLPRSPPQPPTLTPRPLFYRPHQDARATADGPHVVRPGLHPGHSV
jgi:hypothetical protein